LDLDVPQCVNSRPQGQWLIFPRQHAGHDGEAFIWKVVAGMFGGLADFGKDICTSCSLHRLRRIAPRDGALEDLPAEGLDREWSATSRDRHLRAFVRADG